MIGHLRRNLLASYRAYLEQTVQLAHEYLDAIDTDLAPEFTHPAIRQATICAVLRCQRHQISPITVAGILGAPLVTMPVLLAVAVAASQAALALAGRVGLGTIDALSAWTRYSTLCFALALGGALVSSRAVPRLVRRARNVPLSAVNLSGYAAILATPLTVILVALPQEHLSRRQGVILLCAIALPSFATGLVTQQLGRRISLLARGVASGRQPRRPLDPVVWYLLWLVANFEESRDRWTHQRDMRLLRDQATWAARLIELHGRYDRRARLREFNLRREVLADYRKIGELVRLHGLAVARVRVHDDHLRITASLRTGLYAAVSQDWTTLVEHAPEIPNYVRLGRVVRATASPLVLVAAAVTVGFLPGIDQRSVISVRVLLLVAAVLSLAPVGPGVSDTIRSSLDKALPWPKR